MLPQFEVEKLIGRGGMGAVYRGIQLSLERPVAIKVLPPAIEEQDTAFAERFKNEAKLMGRMNHPAIVSVYDFGRTPEGQLYFVMEFVDGTDVQQMIATHGKLPPEHALAVTAHLCDALGYAHKQGIVHRDIKPSNVLIDNEGRVKVADFGLAKLTGPTAQSRGLTQTGMAMGTPDYVAPETLTLGVDVDGRADLYAVGVMLYQMLTGDIPRGMFKMPSQKFQSIDPRFDNIVRHALEHDREERYQSSGDIRRDLDVILTTPYIESGKASSAALPRQPAVAAQASARTVVPQQNPRRAAAALDTEVLSPPPRQSSSLPYVLAIIAIIIGAWFVLHKPAEEAEPVAKTEPPPATEVIPTPTPPPVVTIPKSTPPAPTPTPPTPVPTPQPPAPTPVVTMPVTPQTPLIVIQPPTSTPPAVTAPTAIIGAGLTVEKRLQLLEDTFQDTFDAKINAAYNNSLKDLGTKYLARLDEQYTALRSRFPTEASAIDTERTRYRTHQFMPSIDPIGLSRTVIELRNLYRTAEKAITQQKDRDSLPEYDNYIRALTLIENEAFLQRRVTDAAKIRSKCDDVVVRRKQRAAKITSN